MEKQKEKSGMKILDMTAGGKSMWFDCSLRSDLTFVFSDRNPKEADVIKADWSDRLPFIDGEFDMVVFDPPHLSMSYAGSGKLAQYYGYLLPSWRSDLTHGFSEAFRVVRSGGTVIFKWNTRQYSIYQVLELCDYKPLFGHTTSWTNKSTTLWCLFVKENNMRSKTCLTG